MSEQQIEITEEAEESSRDALEAAYDAAEAEITPEETPPEVTESVVPDDTEGGTTPSASAEPADAPSSDEGSAETADKDYKVDQAPASWTPQAREGWNDLPERTRQEIKKRESDFQAKLRDVSEERNYARTMQQTLQPYGSMFAAQGVDPVTGTNNVLQLAAQLQLGSPQQKAQAAANIIQQFGVDIATLDDMLVGAAPQQAPVDPHVQQMQTQLQQMQQYIAAQQQQSQQQLQAEQARINQETQEFIESHEFANDLRLVMADFMDLAAAQNQPITMEDAYNRALATRPDLQTILQTRQRTQSSQQSVSSARQAAVSVPQTQTGSGSPQPEITSNRDALLAAWDEHS